MNQNQRSNIAAGLVLILLGAAFLFFNLAPDYFDWLDFSEHWALFIIAFGLLLLVIGLLTGASGMAIPASIIGGIGGLLYYQSLSGNWGSWAYAWTLILGFIGVGIFLHGLLSGRVRHGVVEGGRLILISAVAFTIFGALTGGGEVFTYLWPVLIILAGVMMLARNVMGRK